MAKKSKKDIEIDFKKPEFKSVGKYVILGIIIFVLVTIGSTSFFTVDEQQQAVVTTFGKVTTIKDAGFHLKLPFGIQKVQYVDVNVYQKMRIGYTIEDGKEVFVPSESKMITGDYNIVNIDFYIEYKITDPVKYLYKVSDPDLVLRNMLQAQIRNVVGSKEVDSVITDGKSQIQSEIKTLIMQDLEEYDIGLSVINVKIQDSNPPTEKVIEAFKNVETAKQQAQTLINQAKAYENSKLPDAMAEKNRIEQNAQFVKQNRINEARKIAYMFEAMYNEYKNNPEITKERMYYQMIQEILPNADLYIGMPDGTNVLFPIGDYSKKD